MTKGRNTKQKALILNAVLESSLHPSAEQVYISLKDKMEGLSLGTVYRNLSRLAEDGSIRRICVPDAPDRFDRTTEPHNHISCLSCGAFDDIFDVPYDASHDGETADKCGYSIERHETVFYGYCPNCKPR